MQIAFLIFMFILGAAFGSFFCCQARRGEVRCSFEGHPQSLRGRSDEPCEDGREECPEEDISSSRFIQVVCGAPNVHKGMLAAWIAPGAIVPQTYGNENFKISTRKLRGYDSNGMLAGIDELALGDDHSAIVEIDPKMAKPGDSFADVFDLNDTILDIENKSLTHRPDCFGIIGFAREVAGILGQKFTEPTTIDLPKVANRELSIEITDNQICPRYTTAIIEMDDATTDDKYLTLSDAFLGKLGLHGISKIVDVTNILMLETGQPLHAFDYDKFIKVGNTKSPKVIVRLAKDGESLQLLDGNTIKCTPNDILITSSNIPVALAGAMGGASTAIDASTKRVLLESASFSLYNLRKTQMAHGIFSEAITRFTKGIPPSSTAPVLAQAIEMLGGNVVAIADEYPRPAKPVKITLTTHDINSTLGTDYDTDLIIKTLDNVGITISSQNTIFEGLSQAAAETERDTPVKTGRVDATRKNSVCELSVIPPHWRTDLHIKEDIIEEVGRLLGYDNIPLDFPTRPFIGAHLAPIFTLKSHLRNILSNQLGAHEVLTYSFISAKLLKKVGQNPENSYQIVNSISPELQYFRQTITPSLLDKIRENLRSGHTGFTLYEINQISQKSAGLTKERTPITSNHLATVTLGDYYQIKSILTTIQANLKLDLKLQKFTDDSNPYFEPLHSVNIYINDTLIGSMGEIRPQILQNFKLQAPISALELDLDQLPTANPVPSDLKFTKYPATERDITFKVAEGVTFASIHELIIGTLKANDDLVFTVTPTSIYQGANHNTRNLSFHLHFASLTHTLETSEISAIMELITKNITQTLGVEVV